MFRRTCGDLLACFFTLHARLRVRVMHPAFPAPSDFGASNIQNPGVMTPREGGDVACVAWFELWNRDRCLCRPRARGDP